MSDRLAQLLDLLSAPDLEMTSYELADVCWLLLNQPSLQDPIANADQTGNGSGSQGNRNSSVGTGESTDLGTSEVGNSPLSNPLAPTSKPAGQLTPQLKSSETFRGDRENLTLKITDPSALGNTPLKFAQAMRSLLQKVPAVNRPATLDESLTAEESAAANGLVNPVFRPELEPWLELALVVDTNPSMSVWYRTAEDFFRLLKSYGIFRDVRGWRLVCEGETLGLHPRLGRHNQRQTDPKELKDSTGRRMTLIVSDCAAPYWRDERMFEVLKSWSQSGPLAVVQMLPEWMWLKSGLGQGAKVLFRSQEMGGGNQRLRLSEVLVWESVFQLPDRDRVNVPVISLDEDSLRDWSNVTVGRYGAQVAGFVLARDFDDDDDPVAVSSQKRSPEERVARFKNRSSLLAQELAALLAGVPTLFLPVVRLIQKEMLGESGPVQVAEVFLGGILKVWQPHPDADRVLYDFVDPQVRKILQRSTARSRTVQVFERVSKYIAEKLGISLKDFVAELKTKPTELNQDHAGVIQPFAEISAQILETLGGEYARFARDELLAAGLQKSQIFGENRGNVLKDKIAQNYRPVKYLSDRESREQTFKIAWKDSEITCIYSDKKIRVESEAEDFFDACTRLQFVIERLWPRQYRHARNEGELGRDLHNMFPIFKRANHDRGYAIFTECLPDSVIRWIDPDYHYEEDPPLQGNLGDFSKLGENGFEPRDAVKGLVARGMFYFFTLYGNEQGVNQGYFEQQKDVLYRWHLQYPPTPEEVERNKKIRQQQGNDNPFVIDPSLVERIYFVAVPPLQEFEFETAAIEEIQKAPPANTLQSQFRELGELLAEKDWDSAFQLTESIIAQAANVDSLEERPLSDAEMAALPAEIFIELNRVWGEATNGYLSGGLIRDLWTSLGQRAGLLAVRQTLFNFLREYDEKLGVLFLERPLSVLVSEPFVRKIEQHRISGQLIQYEFETVTVNNLGEEITRQEHHAQYYPEFLAEDSWLEMVSIPPGKFQMGSPEDEPASKDTERPQHEVVLTEGFFISKYPITQAQWKAVAELPIVEREIESKPSSFKGGNRPVEGVTWYDAVEFCQRLSQLTGRRYRLPSEAQWEYACRAGTSTPFYFGETLTEQLARYDSASTYGSETPGQSVQETIEVGSYPPNAFGLCDMHGNVYEWCADHWHDSYEGAPTENTVWTTDYSEQSRVLRGGSWVNLPGYCRSARRDYVPPGGRLNPFGFRVMSEPGRTL
ncbi:MAG: SAV_2336 N-terminal domain-related protein [Cyanobacteria bacterium P01_H01_bin.15]